MTIALIDADIVAFRCAASVNTDEDGAKDIALLRTDKLMRDICEATESEGYKAFLTGKNNFRKKINPEYKANRKDKEPPIWLGDCRNYLIEEWNAEVTDGHEADDALGINQTQESIISTIDKDLDMIPGMHYNWVKGEIYEVSEIQAIRHFYKQLLIGDKSDNIFGIDGIGKIKAGKLIDHLEDDFQMFHTVLNLYKDEERFLKNAQCLWIWRKENDIWNIESHLKNQSQLD